jgi:anaerobic selenocysteine-containing dehydrogenase
MKDDAVSCSSRLSLGDGTSVAKHAGQDQRPADPRNAFSRRTFLKGTGVALGAAALGRSFDIIHPAGAIAEDAPEEVKYTYCDMCNHMPKCGIAATVKDGKIVRVESRQKYPASPICAKGISSLQELYDPDRLTVPMVRTNEKGTGNSEWKQISWDEAYARIAEEFNAVKEKYGPEKVLFYCGDPKEPRGAMQRVATLFGSPTYGTESSTCAAATWMSALMTIGSLSMGTDPSDSTGSALVWSLNPAWSQPYRFGKMMDQKQRGCKFVVVDPRVTPTVTGLADIHLQLRPGTDGALALGFLHVMLRDGMYDKDFAENWTSGFDELSEYVAEFDPERVEEITGVPAEKLEAAVKLIWENAPSTLVSSSAGACHSSNVGNFQRAVFSIIALLGSLDVPGGLSMSKGLPFDYSATTAKFRLEDKYDQDGLFDLRPDTEYFPVWAHYFKMIQANRLPEYVADKKIRAGVLLGANAMMWPQTPQYQEAFKNMDFTVAIDYYLRPATHDYVDMVLPAAMCYERMAPFAIFGRKIYLREPVVEPAGECREDWRILLEIGCALGYEEECYGGDVEAALEDMLAGTDLGITLDDLRANPDGYEVPGTASDPKHYETGGIRADGQPGFNTPTGKVELVSEVLKQYGFDGLPRYEEPVYSPVSTPDLAEKYPLVLNSGSRVPFYTHSKLRNLPWLNQFMPDPIVRIHPQDARERGLSDGDEVRVFNQFGEINVKVEISNLVLPGVVDIFHGWVQADVNLLISRDFDPITGFPPFRSALCEVQPV